MPDYQLSVTSPCTGLQDLNETTPGIYAGTQGTYNYVVLLKKATRWEITIYDYRINSNCYPSKEFVQIISNLTDPLGNYAVPDGNGDPDTSLGEASII